MSNDAKQALAINGGDKVRTTPWPTRRLFGEEEKAAADKLFDQVMQSGGVFAYNGAEEEAYCKEFAEYLGGGYCDAVNSGTSAVYVALAALDLEPFTEVIVPPVTDPGGVMPVPLLNLVPVPADCAPGSYNMGPEQIEARLTERTSAILVAHITGQPVDMDGVMALAKKHNLKVVEDCAQSHGATYKGQLVGTFGDTAAFSTMSGKHHATGGQGGVVFTKNEDYYWAARRASDRGKPFNIQGDGTYVIAAHNLNLNDLSAAIGRVQLRKLPSIVEGCQCAGFALAEKTKHLEAVEMVLGVPESKSAFWFALFRLNLDKLTCDMGEFLKAANGEGGGFAGPYVKPITMHTWYKEKRVFGSSGLPWTAPQYKGDPNADYPTPNWEEVDRTVFRFKIHERFTSDDVADIAAILEKTEKAFLK